MSCWYEKKKAVVMTLMIILCLAGLGLLKLKFGTSPASDDAVVSLVVENRGVESTEMERSATIPLEEALSSISGIRRLRTVSEYGKSRADMALKKGVSYETFYLELRDAAERIYGNLPSSAQKPRILSGRGDDRPSFIVSFKPPEGETGRDAAEEAETLNRIREIVEKRIKPVFEKIEGAGEVQIGGGNIRELHIAADTDKISALGLRPSDIALLIRKAQVDLPAGFLKNNASDLPVFIKGTASDEKDFRELILPLKGNKSTALENVAEVNWSYREIDSISRVAGEKRIGLYVRSDGTANVLNLCAQLRREVENLADSIGDSIDADILGSPEILYDQGKDLGASITMLGKALFASMVLVCAVFIAFRMEAGKTAVLAFFLPLTLVVTAAFVSVIGVSIDEYILTGFVLGTGMIVDSGIVILESGGTKKIRRPLVSSVITTVVVLLPLLSAGGVAPGLKQITMALVTMLMVSLILGLVFLPAYPEKKAHGKKFGKRLRTLGRGTSAIVSCAVKRPCVIGGVSALFVAAAAFSLAFMGKDFGRLWTDDVIFAHVEFESGAALHSTDRRLLILAQRLENHDGVVRVETLARPGSGKITMRIDDKKISRDYGEKLLKITGEAIPGCFVYLPQSDPKGKRSMELVFYGDDYLQLKDIAKAAATILNEDGSITETVLHFKEDPPSFIYKPNPEKLFAAGFFPYQTGETLSAVVQGPVIIKWRCLTEAGREERDIRIMGKGSQNITLEGLSSIPIAARGVSHVLGDLGRFTRGTEPSRIYRQNKRRAVYLTVHGNVKNVEQLLRRIGDRLSSLHLPEGYAWEADDRVFELKEKINRLFFLLALAVVLTYMTLASLFESFIYPFCVLAIVPASLSFPILVLTLSGGSLTVPVLTGLIMLSGMAVNNGILIIDRSLSWSPGDVKSRTKISVRKRLKPMAMTSVTTILGAVPLLFTVGDSGVFMRTLAIIMITGIAGSALSALTVLPSLLVLTDGTARRHP